MSKFLLTIIILSNIETCHAQVPTAPKIERQMPLSYESGTGSVLKQMSDEISQIGEQAEKGVVLISVTKTVPQTFPDIDDFFEFFRRSPGTAPERNFQEKSIGSGFFINLKNGYILTNNHVVEGADEITVTMVTGKEAKGKTVGEDPNTDIAVIRLTDFDRSEVKELTLGDSDQVKTGELAIALGAPFGLSKTLSLGVISALGRGSLGISTMGDYMQTDAAINPGNSGGPLLNSSGQVIGVNSAIVSPSGASSGIGFAVPANLARFVSDRLIKDGKITRGYLGVGIQALTEDLVQNLDLPAQAEKGSLVTYVEQGSPAESAGLQPGDVIIQVNEKKLDVYSDLINYIGFLPPGTNVKLVYFRKNKVNNTTLTVAAWPGEVETHKKQTKESLFGLSLVPLSTLPMERSNYKSAEGLVVQNVKHGSAGDKAGILAGDLLVAVGDKGVASIKQFQDAISDKDKIVVRIERMRQFVFVVLQKSKASS